MKRQYWKFMNFAMGAVGGLDMESPSLPEQEAFVTNIPMAARGFASCAWPDKYAPASRPLSTDERMALLWKRQS